MGLVFHQNVARDSKSKHVLIKSSLSSSSELKKSSALRVMPNPEMGKLSYTNVISKLQ